MNKTAALLGGFYCLVEAIAEPSFVVDAGENHDIPFHYESRGEFHPLFFQAV